MDTVAKRIRAARALRGLTQKGLAKKISNEGGKISCQSIQNIDGGKTKHSSFLPDIAKGLNIRYEWLFSGDGCMSDGNVAYKTPPTLGARIRLARQIRGLTIEYVASQLAITKQRLSYIERRGRSNSINRIKNLATILNVSFDWLLSGEGDIADDLKLAVQDKNNRFVKVEITTDYEDAMNIISKLQAKLGVERKVLFYQSSAP